MSDEFKEHLFEIDNTTVNKGIPASHNLGIAKMRSEGADWLLTLSAAVRFGPNGGKDVEKVFIDNPDCYVIHFCNPDPEVKIFGWHATAFHRTLFDNIGEYDSNMFPYNYDDIDLSLRIQKYYKGRPGWSVFPIDLFDTSMAHSIHLAGLEVDAQPQVDYMTKKWGRHPSAYQEPTYGHPFNDPSLPLSFWPKPPDPRAISHAGWDL
jgi:hypothetical protein